MRPSPPRPRPALLHTQRLHPPASWVKVLDDSMHGSCPCPTMTFETLKCDTDCCGPSVPCKSKTLNVSYIDKLEVASSRGFH